MEVQGIVGECSKPRQGNKLPFRPNNQTQNRNDGKNLNGKVSKALINSGAMISIRVGDIVKSMGMRYSL